MSDPTESKMARIRGDAEWLQCRMQDDALASLPHNVWRVLDRMLTEIVNARLDEIPGYVLAQEHKAQSCMASGVALDKIGRMLDCRTREPGEPDAEYRKMVQATLDMVAELGNRPSTSMRHFSDNAVVRFIDRNASVIYQGHRVYIEIPVSLMPPRTEEAGSYSVFDHIYYTMNIDATGVMQPAWGGT